MLHNSNTMKEIYEHGSIIRNPVYQRFESMYIDKFARPITDAICEYFECTPDYFKQRSRKEEIKSVRQIYCYCLQRFGGFGLRQISNLAGYKKDRHETVLHGIRVIENRLSYIGQNGNRRPLDAWMIKVIFDLELLIKNKSK